MHRLELASLGTKHKDSRTNCTLETAKLYSKKHVKAPFDLCFLERGFHCNLPNQGIRVERSYGNSVHGITAGKIWKFNKLKQT